MKPHTVATILESLQNRTISNRDGEILLVWALACNKTALIAHPERTLTTEELARVETAFTRRERNEPVAYIMGEKEFYGRPFTIDHRALIPRPETEGIIDLTLAFLQTIENPRILELGTGCGAIAVTLAAELTKPVSFTITEYASEALELAQENWKKLVRNTHQVLWLEADLTNHPEITGPFDLIVMNLPYVENYWKHDPRAQQDVVFWEPEIALFGGEDGLTLYRQVFPTLPALLATPGMVVAEHGDLQGEAMASLAGTYFPDAQIITHQDYAGLDRLVSVTH